MDIDNTEPASSTLEEFVDGQVEEMNEDELYEFNEQEYAKLTNSSPWEKDPSYFKKVKISALAVLKMTVHASAGGNLEIMGIMVGRAVGDTLLVVDTYPLPIVGTESRVTDMASDPIVGEYLYYNLISAQEKLGRKEKLIGWYHSHPGFGCWLSKVDCGTQMASQKGGPSVAVVVDPYQTKSSGKVELAAFRCYPEGHKAKNATPSGQVIPKEKLLEFGSCADTYYKLDVEYFKTSFQQQMFDKLWSQFWVQTLSSSPLMENAEYSCNEIKDLGDKFKEINSGRSFKDSEENPLTALKEQSAKISTEAVNGLISQVLKDSLFNSPY